MDPVVHSHLRSGASGLSLAASLDVFYLRFIYLFELSCCPLYTAYKESQRYILPSGNLT